MHSSIIIQVFEQMPLFCMRNIAVLNVRFVKFSVYGYFDMEMKQLKIKQPLLYAKILSGIIWYVFVGKTFWRDK